VVKKDTSSRPKTGLKIYVYGDHSQYLTVALIHVNNVYIENPNKEMPVFVHGFANEKYRIMAAFPSFEIVQVPPIKIRLNEVATVKIYIGDDIP